MIRPLNRAEDAHRNKGLGTDEVTIAEVLVDAGFRTALIGKWHLGHGAREFLPTSHGFERFFGHTGGCVDMFTLRYGNIRDWYEGEHLVDPTGYATDVVTEEAIHFIRRQRRDSPFFLYLAFAAPHYGKGWDEKEGKLLNILQAKPETIARMASIPDRDRRIYAAMVVELDEAVGRVLEALDQSGLADGTWVVFASDNGGDVDFGGDNGPLRGEKGTLWEGGIRVPCLMRWPGRIEPGTVIDQPSMALDFLPTACRILGVPMPLAPLDGIDCSAAWFGGGQLDRDVFYLRGEDASLRRGRWKYLRMDGVDYLFDLASDPGEKKNLAADHPNLLVELAAHVARAAGMRGADSKTE